MTLYNKLTPHDFSYEKYIKWCDEKELVPTIPCNSSRYITSKLGVDKGAFLSITYEDLLYLTTFDGWIHLKIESDYYFSLYVHHNEITILQIYHKHIKEHTFQKYDWLYYFSKALKGDDIAWRIVFSILMKYKILKNIENISLYYLNKINNPIDNKNNF